MSSRPAGAFEFNNEFYPDIDDTAMVLLAFDKARGSDRRANSRPARSGPSNWLLAMQGKDGGWAAFDVDNNWQIPEPSAVCGSQRHARSLLSGHHRPGDRSAVRSG